MNIDLHYGVVYITARLAGMPPEHVRIATDSRQYVDDAIMAFR